MMTSSFNPQSSQLGRIDPTIFGMQLIETSMFLKSNESDESYESYESIPMKDTLRPLPVPFKTPVTLERSVSEEKSSEDNSSSESADGSIDKNTAELVCEYASSVIREYYARRTNYNQSVHDVKGVEPSFPRAEDLGKKRQVYEFTRYPDAATLSSGDPKAMDARYPPHLDPLDKDNIDDNDKFTIRDIFDKWGLLKTFFMLEARHKSDFADKIFSIERTMAQLEKSNKKTLKRATDVQKGQNIGLLEDWYSDRRFAEQSFAGTNPTTISKDDKWVEAFRSEAQRQLQVKADDLSKEKKERLDNWIEILSKKDADFLVQDCSYFRNAVGADNEEELASQGWYGGKNWACASVTLFQLHSNGQLHPVAIAIDYKGSLGDSITIFNKNHAPKVPTYFPDRKSDEETDWPWRYAKTCAQVSDWIRHEVGVHLTRAHFIEEVIIVATHRQIPSSHAIFKLLNPHWYKTLALNASARSTLVPEVVKDIVGFTPTQLFKFIDHEFKYFNYTDNYVPADLKRRGFPATLRELAADKYKNYIYAKNILSLWECIREYVSNTLAAFYGSGQEADQRVQGDEDIENWYQEIQNAGGIKSFPSIKTFEELVDAITMSIHIASPFHTAINYLQNYYQAFIPSKPPALSQQLPLSLEDLEGYTENHLIEALPIHSIVKGMLTVQVPWLLSFQVEGERSLMTFAESQLSLHKLRGENNSAAQKTTETFYNRLKNLTMEFQENENKMDIGRIAYRVLDPSSTAVSILI